MIELRGLKLYVVGVCAALLSACGPPEVDGAASPAPEGLGLVEEALTQGWGSIGSPHGRPIQGSPAVCSWSPGRMDVFVRGDDSALWHIAANNRVWGAWETLGGVIASEPACISVNVGRLDVFALGQDKAMWGKTYLINGGWYAWVSLGGSFTSAPAVAAYKSNQISLIAMGQNNEVFESDSAVVGKGWTSWYQATHLAAGGTPAVAAARPAISFNAGVAVPTFWNETGSGPFLIQNGRRRHEAGLLGSAPSVALMADGTHHVAMLDQSGGVRIMTIQEGTNCGWVTGGFGGGVLNANPAILNYHDNQNDTVGSDAVFGRGGDGGVWYALTDYQSPPYLGQPPACDGNPTVRNFSVSPWSGDPQHGYMNVGQTGQLHFYVDYPADCGNVSETIVGTDDATGKTVLNYVKRNTVNGDINITPTSQFTTYNLTGACGTTNAVVHAKPVHMQLYYPQAPPPACVYHCYQVHSECRNDALCIPNGVDGLALEQQQNPGVSVVEINCANFMVSPCL